MKEEIKGFIAETAFADPGEIKEDTLEEYSLTEWKSTNDYYEAIEEKFTSYIERKTASETFASDAVDTGSEGGELTLF